MLAGEKSARRWQVSLFSIPDPGPLLSLLCAHQRIQKCKHDTNPKFCFFPFLFSVAVVVEWGTVKYFSSMTNLCIIRVSRGAAASTTWAALVLLDGVGIGGAGQGHGCRIIPHEIHVSGMSYFAPIFVLSLSPGFVK
jgi:hypothetical protein